MTAAETAAKAAAEKQVQKHEEDLKKQQTAVVESAESATVVVHGREGGAFSIEGSGFGSKGTLSIGGQVIPTTRWDDRSIRGILPVGTRGIVELKTSNGTRYGAYPAPAPVPMTRTTTIVETVPSAAVVPGVVTTVDDKGKK